MKVSRRVKAEVSALTLLALSTLATGVLAVTSGGSDVADVVPEWTPDGKKAAAHLATLPPKDEMVLVPPGRSSWEATARWTATPIRRGSLSGRVTSTRMRSTST